MSKWIIKLAMPTIVNTSLTGKGDGELRQPAEGALTVTEAEAKRLFDNGKLEGEPEPHPDNEEEDEDDGLEKLKVADLHALALKEGVALNDATKKDEIITAIRKHRDEKAG